MREEPALKQIQINVEPLDRYAGLWEKTRAALSWHCPFVLPFWLETVHHHLGDGQEPHIVTITDNQTLIGIVPLAMDQDRAQFIGPHHVCDYQDIVAAPGHAPTVMTALLDHLSALGLKTLDLRTLRPDAKVLSALNTLAAQKEIRMTTAADDVTFETGLPADWDGYLMQLSGKQRHEVRRKIRRLEANGSYTFRMASNTGDLEPDMNLFFHLFRSNRRDKAQFMTPAMEDYFKALIQGLAEHRMLRLCFLEVKDQPTATALCFDYNGTRYLYNSGYDDQYDELSVGILSKVFSIQNAIETGCTRYDFLKGQEVYKGRIGGNPIDLHHYTIDLSDLG